MFHDLLYQPAIGPLLLMARVTERIRLGPAALNPFTLHPYEIAGQIAMLDAVSGGRAYLGLVKGAWLEQLGLDEKRPLTALREAVEIVRALLAGDAEGFEGERFTLARGTTLAYPRVRETVPLTIGTWGPATARWAGTVADEVKVGGTANPALLPVVRGWIGNERVKLVTGCVTVVDEDGDWARQRAREVVEALRRRRRPPRSDPRRRRAPARALLHRGDAGGGRRARGRALGRGRGPRRARDSAGTHHDRRRRADLRARASAPPSLRTRVRYGRGWVGRIDATDEL